jgi:uncharacterized protein DUF6194
MSMDETLIAKYIIDTFPGVETIEDMGYVFFFYGAERYLPLATIATADNEGDRVSNLDRPGVFRLNIGISRPTFQSLFGVEKVDTGIYDYAALDKIMPHPDYARQYYVCVLNPSDSTFERVRALLAEAYDLAVQRERKREAHR